MKRNFILSILTCILIFCISCTQNNTSQIRKWQTVTLDFAGPEFSELDTDPNPFLDYRLNVKFTHASGKSVVVPGFFDGDGGGNGTGAIWRVRFTPDEIGEWRYSASFRKGKDVAVNLESDAGASAAYFDGQTGTFNVAPADLKASGFAKWGRLEHVQGHYLKYRDGGYWIKGGADSPEDMLGYTGFDNTPPKHKFAAHIQDWNAGDPDWNDGAGKGIIGMLNYLSAHYVNSIYLLLMNIGGDGKNVWPYAGNIDPQGHPDNNNLNFDISKLSQWEIVFKHAQNKGLHLQFVLNEAEKQNKIELDNAELGVERKLYYREMIARFSHHLSLQWNLCEEYDLGILPSYNLGLTLDYTQIQKWAEYISQTDPYHHPLTVHNWDNTLKKWEPFVGDQRFTATSFQYYALVHPEKLSHGDMVERFRKLTENAGWPIPVFFDEFYQVVAKDTDTLYQNRFPFKNGFSYMRKHVLWPVYLSGGAGVEVIFNETLKTDDYYPYEKLWLYLWNARKFMEVHLPYWEMEPSDTILTNQTNPDIKGEVFEKGEKIFALYLPVGENHWELDLSPASGEYHLTWYNPRTGEFEGEPVHIRGGLLNVIPDPPSDADEDWVVLITEF